MRFSLSVSGILLAALPMFASAQDYVAEAPVAFAFIASRTGAEQVTDTRNGGTEERAERSVFRVGMLELLDRLIELEIIPPGRVGWRVVAVWADWPERGSGYRFYVQNIRDRADVRAIPDSVLHFEVMDSATARKHTLSGDTIIGGSETYTSYARLEVSTSTGAGIVNGLATSIDIYRRPPGSDAAVYLPGATKFGGTGVWDDSRPDQPDALLEGRFLVGGMRIVPDTPYQTDLATGGNGGTILISAGNLQLTGGTVVSAGGGTLALPPVGATISFTAPPVATDTTLSSPLAGLGLIGTVTLATGITLQPSDLTLSSGDSLSFSGGALTLFDPATAPTGNFISDGAFVTGALFTAP